MKTKTSILALKTFFILLVICCFSSCESWLPQSNLDKQTKTILLTPVNINGYEIFLVEYDSCEYLISGSGYSQMMTHKGNCKFCAERSLK